MSYHLLREMAKTTADLLQCNICFTVPGGSIFNCPTGHSVCEDCYGRLRVCPSCGIAYQKLGGGSRNFALESVLQYHQNVAYSNFAQDGEDSGDNDGNNNASSSNDGQQRQSSDVSREHLHLVCCPYKTSGCKLVLGVDDSESRMKRLIEHTKSCAYRPIECLVPPPRAHKRNEIKRFCGFSQVKNEQVVQEIPWEKYLEHLKTEHGALSLCFKRFPSMARNVSIFRTKDSIKEPTGLINSEFSWPMQLIQAHGQTFIRQQWIYKGEIQNRVFGFADVSSFKVAVKVKGQYGQGFNQPELATPIGTINVLPIRAYGQEMLKLGWPSSRSDYTVMKALYADRNLRFIAGLGEGGDDHTHAWYTWIEIRKTNSDLNKCPIQ